MMKRRIKDTKAHVEQHIINQVKKHASKLDNSLDLDPIMEKIGEGRYVLLGEASHGTHEYYTWRTKITKRLIMEKGFSFVGVEGDWPDCYRLNRYVKGYADSGKSAFDVLNEFNRWPTWMWANWEIVAFAEWLKEYNSSLPMDKRVGFYGLDVYSLNESLDAILAYLKKTDMNAYKMAEEAIVCFEMYGAEGIDYARNSRFVPDSCEDEVVDLLNQIRFNIQRYNTDHETVFSTEQNALVAVNAENYYREMVKGGPGSWNIRDRHMTETLERLMKFHGDDAKAVIWEHNTHIGDARATDMAGEGMINIGELISHKHHEEGVYKVGFGSYSGTVIAGRRWGGQMQELPVPEGMAGSWEELLHEATDGGNALLLLDKWLDDPLFQEPIGHRAIGVVYHPEMEQRGNYVPSIIPYRYDAFIFIDETKALHPLHIKTDGNKLPDLYPWGE